MVCAPVRSIIPSLKLGDYLSVQAHKPCSISHVFIYFQIIDGTCSFGEEKVGKPIFSIFLLIICNKSIRLSQTNLDKNVGIRGFKASFLLFCFWGGREVRWCCVKCFNNCALIEITVGQGPTALAVVRVGVVWTFFLSSIIFSHLSPSLWETARYSLKYCLKRPLMPK